MLRITGYNCGKIYATNNYERIELVDKKFTKKIEKDYEVYYKLTNIKGVVAFGCKQLTSDSDHEAGYVWASRPSVINKYFDTDFVDIYIDSIYGFAISADVVAPMLEEYFARKGKQCKVVPQKHTVYDDEISYTFVTVE